MKQSYEDFVKELEELWTDENIKDVLDYMGVEYDYLENNDINWDKKGMDSVRYKFRALGAATNEWVYGYYVVLDSGFEMVECIWELGAKRATPIDRSTLGQFTGLTDKNGKEIYEGDIITTDIDSIKGTLIYRYGCFQVKYGHEKYESLINISYPEVIGNIYQHKHLLKGNE